LLLSETVDVRGIKRVTRREAKGMNGARGADARANDFLSKDGLTVKKRKQRRGATPI
jgi:hypothetical protein